MKCEKCKEQEATIHFTQVKDGKIVSYNLCQGCSGKMGLQEAKFDAEEQPAFAPENKTEVLSDLVQSGIVDEDVKCPNCGSKVGDIKSSGRLGCGKCYFVFEQQIDVLLRRIQGSSFHIGKRTSTPDSGIYEDQNLIRDLKKRLNQAVNSENYEKAASIRDEIISVEKRL